MVSLTHLIFKTEYLSVFSLWLVVGGCGDYYHYYYYYHYQFNAGISLCWQQLCNCTETVQVPRGRGVLVTCRKCGLVHIQMSCLPGWALANQKDLSFTSTSASHQPQPLALWFVGDVQTAPPVGSTNLWHIYKIFAITQIHKHQQTCHVIHQSPKHHKSMITSLTWYYNPPFIHL